jgi:dephospho-CoA kinase
MRRVGLTGGIGAGKTTVGRMFVELGAHLIDADVISHELFRPGQPVYHAVVEAFGPRVVAADGSIDRAVLGEIVFNDPAARTRLNSIVHPAVIQRQQDWLDELESRDPHGVAIVDAALMVEVGTYTNYDKVVVVVCSPEEQRRRLRERSGLTEEQIEARIAAQMPMPEKAKFGDHVIDTNGTLDDTRSQVESVWHALKLYSPQRRTGPQRNPDSEVS